MVEEIIGLNAGKIWTSLHSSGSLTKNQMLRQTHLTEDEFDQAIGDLDYMVGQIGDMVSYFGDAFDRTGPQEILQEQIDSAMLLLNTLDPTSQAYMDLWNSINEANLAMLILSDTGGGTTSIIDELADGVGGLGSEMDDATDAVDDFTYAWMEMINEVVGEYDSFENSVRDTKDLIDTLMFFNIDLDTTEADEHILETIRNMQDYLNTLDPRSEAYREAAESIGDLIELYEQLAGAINDVPNRVPTPRPNGTAPTGGGSYHGGGLVTAHTGMLFPNETMVKALQGEYMLRPAATGKFGALALDRFNASLDPGVLMPRGGGMQNIDIRVERAAPETRLYVNNERVDNDITPRVKETLNYNTIKPTNFR